MCISSTMSLGARVSLLLVPLVTALGPPVAQSGQSGDVAGLVDVGGGRKMYLECRGVGSPTVVLVAGLKGSAEDWNIAEKPGPRVFPEVRSRAAATRCRSRRQRGRRSPICMLC